MKNKNKPIILGLLLLLCVQLAFGQSNITRIEYFIDNDPGYGLATSVSITPSANIANLTIPLNPTPISGGIHSLHIRAKDAAGAWSLQNTILFYKPYNLGGSAGITPNLSKLEYYLDNDPGYGLGVNVTIPASTDIANLVIPIDPTPMSSGMHVFHIRAKDANGAWSLNNSKLFFKPYGSGGSAIPAPNITRIEYYFDQDPGQGMATNVPISPGINFNNLIIPVNSSLLESGMHTFHVRAKDANGSWSLLNSTLVFKPYNLGSSSTLTPNITRVEYFIDNDPGYGQAIALSISQGTDLSNLVIPIDPETVGTGEHKLSVRAMDANGNWSLLNTTTFNSFAAAVSSTPLNVTGFNADVVADIAGNAVGSTTAAFDNGYGVLMSQSYNPSGPSFMPVNGVVNSFFRPGLNFQLRPYTGNNSLRLTTGNTGTLTATSPVSAEAVYLLGASGTGAASTTNVTVTFSDLSTQTFNARSFPDYFYGSDYAIRGMGRTYQYYNTIENNPTEPRLYALKLALSPANQSKPIQSISFNSVNGLINVMAVSIGNSCSGTPAPGITIASAASVCPNTPFTLSLQNSFFGSGITYQWQRSDNAAFTQNVIDLGTSYSQQTTQLSSKYYRCRVSCNSGGTAYSNPVQVGIFATPSVSITGPGGVCSGSSVSFTAGGASSYLWAHNASTNPVQSLSPAFNTTYTVTGTNVNGCTNTASKSLVVNQLPVVSASPVIGCSSAPLALIGSPAGGTFNKPNPYTGPSTTYTYTYTDVNGCTVTSAPANITTYTSLTYYADADGDGYGNPSVSQNACAQPVGYVQNNSDCNDADSLQRPGQLWYVDNDGDGYGIGTYLVQCSRPANRYTASELLSVSGDCDDSNPMINPGAQYFAFSGTPNFTASLISPLNGNAYTTFNFEATYYDVNGGLPPATFPRVVLDFEGNNNYTDYNDRVIIMIPADIFDLNTVNGKKFIATAVNLPIGVNYQTSIQSTNNGCNTIIGPFNYPDVLQSPDIEIFANDITFSIPHPPISSPLTVSATIHNVSDYAATNFVVHLRNQYDTTLVFPDITVPYLAPQGDYTVSWNFITPAVPAWCPMEVTIDYTNVIAETNELDNSAIRPFINGNYNLPGGIHVNSYVNPSVGYPGSYTTLYGSAYYFGTAIPLTDSSVAGATVNFTIVETGASYSAYTNSYGNFAYSFPNPMATGVYHIQGTVTDFTLTGNFTDSFELIAPIITNCTLPDLLPFITASNPYNNTATNGGSIVLIEGDHLTGNVNVKNIGQTTAAGSVLNISNPGAVPALGSGNIAGIASGGSNINPFDVMYNTAGYYNFTSTSDITSAINECDEYNTRGIGVTVLPALPDIAPYSGPGGTVYNCQIAEVSFTLINNGGSATGPFNVTVVRKLDGTTIGTDNVAVSSIPSALYYPTNFGAFTIPFTPVAAGAYSFEIKCDLPANAVVEYSEINNEATYLVNILACKPNFTFETCESFDVTSGSGDYATGSNITLQGVLTNSGNLAYNGPIGIRYQLSGGIVFNDVLNVNMAPGTSLAVSKVIVAPPPASKTLTLSVDPNNLIDELSEADNTITNNMCWDFYIDSTSACYGSSYFWNRSFLVNQAAYLAVGVVNPFLYDADTLHVKFEVSGPGLSGTVNLGNAVLYNVEQTCFCPVLVYLPTSFVFPQLGTYTFKITVDPDGKYIECNEGNNVLIRSVNVVNLPDMRVLSQFIAPSLLNPSPGQPISLNITYENIGYPNATDQMKLKVLVDNVPLATINNVSGLMTGDNTTIAIPNTWSSMIPGVHVVRAIIDADNTITELDELNNEATRAIVVGESANLHFKIFTSLNLYPALNAPITVRARIGNNGDLACQGNLQLYYVNNSLDTIPFSSTPISLNPNDSINLIIPWVVLDNKTTIIGKLVNASVLEYTYDDNMASFELGKMVIIMGSQPACGANNVGSLTANVVGGEPPFSYFWNIGAFNQVLNASVGTYSVTVTDATGKIVQASGTIIPCPPVTLTLNMFIQGYYDGGGFMKPVLQNQGQLNLASDVDSVTVELHNTSSPYGLVATYKGILQTNGNLVCYFPSNTTGQSYYLAVKHRNLIQTWSAAPVLLSTVCAYSFSTAANQAYGANQVTLGLGLWGMYSGDISLDENIDLLDANLLEVDIANFEFGYLATDVNGDGNVDLLDSPTLETNINNFVFGIHP